MKRTITLAAVLSSVIAGDAGRARMARLQRRDPDHCRRQALDAVAVRGSRQLREPSPRQRLPPRRPRRDRALRAHRLERAVEPKAAGTMRAWKRERIDSAFREGDSRHRFRPWARLGGGPGLQMGGRARGLLRPAPDGWQDPGPGRRRHERTHRLPGVRPAFHEGFFDLSLEPGYQVDCQSVREAGVIAPSAPAVAETASLQVRRANGLPGRVRALRAPRARPAPGPGATRDRRGRHRLRGQSTSGPGGNVPNVAQARGR